MSDQEWLQSTVPWGDAKKTSKASPKPGGAISKEVKLAGSILLLAILTVGFWLAIGSLYRQQENAFMNRMVSDAIQQYQIVASGSDFFEKSIRAGVVADAYLAAKNSEEYHKWKAISEQWLQEWNRSMLVK